MPENSFVPLPGSDRQPVAGAQPGRDLDESTQIEVTLVTRRQEGLPAEVSQIEVRDASAAEAWKFFGSPTIRINGLDIEAESRTVTETGFACRRYSGGLPSEEMIRAALREAREQ
jgi:hypothetical protein